MNLVVLIKSKGNLPIGTLKKYGNKYYAKLRRGESGWKVVGHGKTKAPKGIKGRKLHMKDTFQKDRDKEEGKRRERYIEPEFRQKALMAGSGVNAANYTGGRALSIESLEGGEPKRKKRKKEAN